MYQKLSDRQIIEIKGTDAIKFLNALCTNKIVLKKLSYTYFLNNQGRYLFDCFLYCENDETIYLDVSSKISEPLVKYLSIRKLRSKVNIINDNKYQLFYSKTEPKSDPSIIFAAKDNRNNKLGYRICTKTNSALEKLITEEDLIKEDKYNYAIVDGCDDMVYEKSIPIEYNAEEQNALSFDKGCYLGQEVISRAKYQGIIRKKIFSLKLNDDTKISQNDSVTNLQGDKLGVITSVYKNKALALLRHGKLTEHETLGKESLLVGNISATIKN